MIFSNHITTTESPPDSELEYLAALFERSYVEHDPNSFRRFAPKKKNGDRGEFYSHFVNLHKLFQQIPELDHKAFIRAQFHYNGCPILPWQLLNPLSLVRYCNYMDLDTSRKKQEKDYEFVLVSDHRWLCEFCRSYETEPSLANLFEIRDKNGNAAFLFEHEYNAVPNAFTLANSRSYRNAKEKFATVKPTQNIFSMDQKLDDSRHVYVAFPRLVSKFKQLFGEQESEL